MPLLRVRKGGHPAAVHPVYSSNEGTTIGRKGHSDVGLEDARTSRRHARLYLEHGTWHLEDLQSSNGTILQGKRTTRSVITDGSLLQVGGVLLSFHERELAPPAEREVHGVELLETLREESAVFVFRGRQGALDREVRCDWLHPAREPSAKILERLRSAVEEAQKVDDEALLPPLAVGAEATRVFSLVRFLPDTLASRWAELSKAPLGLRIDILRDLLDAALERAAWSALRVPLSPAHVCLEPTQGSGEGWRIRLPAIELAAMQAEEAGDTIHIAHYVPYLAPEAAGGGPAAPEDPPLARTMYSAGALGYHLLTGVPPMGEGSCETLLKNHRELTAAPASLVCPGVPEAISDLLERLLAKDPRARPRGRAEALEPFARLPRPAPQPASPPRPVPPAAPRPLEARPTQPAAQPRRRTPPQKPSPAPKSPLRSLLQLPLWILLSVVCFFAARVISKWIFETIG